MIPTSARLDQSAITALLDDDALVQRYRTLFACFDWSLVEAWQAQRTGPGRPAHPMSAYLKAFLLRINEGLRYTTDLRRFLLEHPLLVIEFGFHLVLDPHALFGFDVERTLPCRSWLGHQLRHLDRDLLHALLAATVTALQAEIPGLGDTVAFDVKHIYAWVKENNPRAYVADRYDKTRIPAGDPDCTLGVKRSSNQHGPDEPDAAAASPSATASVTEAITAPREKKVQKEYLWGYGSGVAAATVPGYGDVVLAEFTQPFNENDITYFRSLYEQSVIALNRFPTHVTADAAFDAWYVYECAARHGGIGAVPLNGHGHPDTPRDRDAVPICQKGLRMVSTLQFTHPNGYRAQRFCCPLLVPEATGETCDHPQFLKGIGCRKDPNWEAGGRMRVTLDRTGPLYQAIYQQRTSCERINSQAKELGIERPKVRNRQSVANLNTLIYMIINVRALDRAKSINKGLLQMS